MQHVETVGFAKMRVSDRIGAEKISDAEKRGATSRTYCTARERRKNRRKRRDWPKAIKRNGLDLVASDFSGRRSGC
jgi:hypothetical protein